MSSLCHFLFASIYKSHNSTTFPLNCIYFFANKYFDEKKELIPEFISDIKNESNLTDEEMQKLEELCESKMMSKSQLIKIALYDAKIL